MANFNNVNIEKDAEAARRIYSQVMEAVQQLNGCAWSDEVARHLLDNNSDQLSDRERKRILSIVQIALYKAVGRKELRYEDGKYRMRGSTPPPRGSTPPPMIIEPPHTDEGKPTKIAKHIHGAKTKPTTVKPKLPKPSARSLKVQVKTLPLKDQKHPTPTPGTKEVGRKIPSKAPSEGGAPKRGAPPPAVVEIRNEAKQDEEEDMDEDEEEEQSRNDQIRASAVERERKARALAKIRAGRAQKPDGNSGGQDGTMHARMHPAMNGAVRSVKPSKYCR